MSIGRRLLVRVLARGLRRAQGGHHTAMIRQAFDRRYASRDAEWRRDVWREAAERAAR